MNEQIYKLFVIIHNKIPRFVTLNEVKSLKKIPHCVRNDKFLCNFEICSFIVKKMTAPVAEFVMNYYASAKQDLATVFILKSMNMIRQNGYIALITQHGWMFQSSYEQLREYVLSYLLANMIHLGAGAFEEISGEVVQTTSFVVKKSAIKKHNSIVVRLIDNANKEEGFLNKRHERIVNPEKLNNIPGKVFAYWLTDTVINAFRSNSISSYAANFQGIIPGKAEYLKLWHEIQFDRIRFHDNDPAVLEKMDAFYPYAKGGAFRRWYGNNSYVLQWKKNGRDFIRSRTDNRDLFFKGGITWSDISTGLYCARQFNNCQLFDAAGPVIIPYHKDSACYLLGFMNTVVFQSLIDIVCQGLHYGNGAVTSRPVIIHENDRPMVNTLTTENISYSKQDWDSFETSWDFKKHPLIYSNTIKKTAELT